MLSLSRKKKIIYISMPIVLLLLILVGTEVYVRATQPYISTLALFTNIADPDRLDGNGEEIFEADPLLGWKLKSNLTDAYWDFTGFSTNSGGLRYHSDINEKEKDTIRIMSMGDSVTFGYRVPVYFSNDPNGFSRTQLPYPLQLEKSLNASYPEKQIEVIPFGVPGYTTYQGRKWLERDIEKYTPDIITILFGWNDTDLRTEPDTLALGNLESTSYTNVIHDSQALIYATRWLSKHASQDSKENESALVTRVSKRDFVNNILAMNELANKNNAQILVIGAVYRDAITNPSHAARIRDYRNALAQISLKKNIMYIEIPELTELGHPDNDNLFGELIHPNYAGHMLLSRNLSRFIIDEGILE